MAKNVVLVLVVVIRFSNSKSYCKFFISQPIVVKLRTEIGDSIIHYRIVADFQPNF